MKVSYHHYDLRVKGQGEIYNVLKISLQLLYYYNAIFFYGSVFILGTMTMITNGVYSEPL